MVAIQDTKQKENQPIGDENRIFGTGFIVSRKLKAAIVEYEKTSKYVLKNSVTQYKCKDLKGKYL